MARKSLIQRQKKRQTLYLKYKTKRKLWKIRYKTASSLKDKLVWHFKLQTLPKNASPVRLENRCLISGRPKGVFRFFGISRHYVREYAHLGFLPGIWKASW